MKTRLLALLLCLVASITCWAQDYVHPSYLYAWSGSAWQAFTNGATLVGAPDYVTPNYMYYWNGTTWAAWSGVGASGMTTSGSNATAAALDNLATAAGQTGGLKQTDNPAFGSLGLSGTGTQLTVAGGTGSGIFDIQQIIGQNAGVAPALAWVNAPSAGTTILRIGSVGATGVSYINSFGTLNLGAGNATLESNSWLSLGTTGIITMNTANYASCAGLTTNPSGVVGCTASDKRLKDDDGIITPGDGLDAIMKMPDAHLFHFKDGYGPAGQMQGFFAQDITVSRPDLVTKGTSTDLTPDGTLQFDQVKLVADLVQAVKAQQSEIVAQRKRIIHLERHLK